MKNAEIKDLIARINKGRALDAAEQVHVLQQLLRANRRIQMAAQAGFKTSATKAAEQFLPASSNGSRATTAEGASQVRLNGIQH